MNLKITGKWIAQCVVVLVCAFALKLYYSSASANELRWILAPTTACVELVSGNSFTFESHAGYISEDRRFLIAPSCAGVNFLITAFLMLSIRKLLSDPSKNIAWGFIPTTAMISYLATLVANTARISIALLPEPAEVSWLNPYQLHRFEGILIYFGFLQLLFMVSENMSSERNWGLFRQSFFPLLVYYATTLGIPLVNGAYRQGSDFWEHSLFVLLIPLVLILPIAAFRFRQRGRVSLQSSRRWMSSIPRVESLRDPKAQVQESSSSGDRASGPGPLLRRSRPTCPERSPHLHFSATDQWEKHCVGHR